MKKEKIRKEDKSRFDTINDQDTQDLAVQTHLNNIAKKAKQSITKDNLDFGSSDVILVIVLFLLIFIHILFGLIQVFFFLNQGWMFYR